jgi:DNA-binding MarR family transcriptional regulator
MFVSYSPFVAVTSNNGKGKVGRLVEETQSTPDHQASSGREAIDVEDRRNLQALEAISEDAQITQRTLASKLGIALGLTNLYLKRLVRKGHIKCVNVQPHRVRYLLTPKGLAEKARLTYEFMEHSLRLYRRTRQHLRVALETGIRDGCRRVAIYGTGEPAELAYMSLKELGLEPVGVFADAADGLFLGMPVRPLTEHGAVVYDLMVVASLENPAPLIARLVEAGVSEAKLCTLRPATPSSRTYLAGGRPHSPSRW